MNVAVNYLAVLVAAIASMVVGFVWYSPILVGNQWAKLMGFTKESLKKAQKEMGKYYSISFVVSLVTAYVLYHVMAMSENFFHYDWVMTGIISAFWMWLGFVMPVQITSVLFAKEHTSDQWKLFGLNTVYQLLSLLAMGVVLGLMN